MAKEGRLVTDWEQIVGEHGPLVYRLARRVTGRNEDAEDVVQEVFAEIFEYELREPVRQWRGLLRRKAMQRSLDRIRRRRPTAPLDDVEVSAAGHSPLQAAIASELATQLRTAIAALPPQQASVFCLRYFEQLSNHEIAQTLGMAVGAVATSLHKARQTLDRVLTKNNREDSP